MANRNWKKTAAFLLAFTLAATPVASNMAVLSASAEEVAVETPVEEVTEEVTEEETVVEETEAVTEEAPPVEEEAEEGTEGFVEAGNLDQAELLGDTDTPTAPTINKNIGYTVTGYDVFDAVVEENDLNIVNTVGNVYYAYDGIELNGDLSPSGNNAKITGFDCSYTLKMKKYTLIITNSGQRNFDSGVEVQVQGTITVNPITLTDQNASLEDNGKKAIYKYGTGEEDFVDLTAADAVAIQYKKVGGTDWSYNYPTEDGEYNVRVRSTDANMVIGGPVECGTIKVDSSDEFKVNDEIAKNGLTIPDSAFYYLNEENVKKLFTNTYEADEYDSIKYEPANEGVIIKISDDGVDAFAPILPGTTTVTATLMKGDDVVKVDEKPVRVTFNVRVTGDFTGVKNNIEASFKVVENQRKLVVEYNGVVVPVDQYEDTAQIWDEAKKAYVPATGYQTAGKYKITIKAKAAEEDAESEFVPLYSGEVTFEDVEVEEFKKISTLVFEKTAYEVKEGSALNLVKGTDYSYLPGEADLDLIEWKSSDDKIATVKDGTVTFVAPGKVTITATAVNGDDKSDDVVKTVEVTAVGKIAEANVTVDKDNKVVVTYGADKSKKTLVEGTDYTINYKNKAKAGDKGTATYPTEPGKYTVTVTGTGLYAGTVTKDLVINAFSEEWSNDVIKDSDGNEILAKTVDKDGKETTTNKYHYHRSTVYTEEDKEEWNEEGKGYDKLVANVYDEDAIDNSYYTCAESGYIDTEKRNTAQNDADKVTKAIKALPAVAKVTSGDVKAIAAVLVEYGKLPNYAKNIVGEANYEKLTNAANKAMALDIDERAAKIDISDVDPTKPDIETLVTYYENYVENAEKYGLENLVSEESKTKLEALTNLYTAAKAASDFTKNIENIKKFTGDAFAYKATMKDGTGEEAATISLEDSIKGARAAYDAMTDDQKTAVTADNLKTLTDAETKYAELKAAYEKLEADEKAVADLVAMVNALEKKAVVTSEDVDPISAAYEALNKEAKAILAQAEEGKTYTTKNYKKDNNTVAIKVPVHEIDLSKLIDDPEIEWKEDNKTIVVDTVEEYIAFASLYVALKNAEPVEKAIDKIDLSEVALDNEESKALIDAAREAYDALSEDDQVFVSNYQDLVNAENYYNSLAAAADAKAAADKAAKDLETANGKVTDLEGQLEEAQSKVADYEQMAKALEQAKKDLADAQAAATEANEALTKATNDLADTKTKLADAETAKEDAVKAKEDAEAKYNALKESANATEEDLAAAKLLIDAADEIIAAADEEIDGLKANVSDLETKIDELTKGKAAADEVVANAVIEKINNIGEVKKTNQSKYLIVSARSAYDTLTDDQKALVDNYDTLEDAEETYAALPQTGMSGAHKAFAGLAALLGAAGFGMFKLGKKKDEDQ